MIDLHSDGSPFLVLWYLFLVFFGLVILINIVMLTLRRVLNWKIARMERKESKRRA